MMLKNIKLFSIASCLAFTACSTVTDKIPTAKIERKKPKAVQTTQANFTTANYNASKVHKAEAALVCENENMRSRSVDNNLNNDTARVLVLEEGGRSSNIIADVEVNCRDYFQNPRPVIVSQQSVATRSTPQLTYVTSQSVAAPSNIRLTEPGVIKTNVQPQSLPQNNVIKASSDVQAADGYYYSIKKGDTLYRIARENCSTVNDISTLNGIYDPTKIEVHQIIRLPAKKCNARN